MRRTKQHNLLVLALALTLAACSDDGGSPADQGLADLGRPDNGPQADQKTADGPAADAATGTKTIGAAGGVVASADGHLVLTVPAGALTQDRVFTITPATYTPTFLTEVPSTVDSTAGTVSAQTTHTSTWCLYDKATGFIACCYTVDPDTQFSIAVALTALYTDCAAMSSVPLSVIVLGYEQPGS